MRLLKQKVERNGVKYTDLYACWTYNGKAYAVRVRPVFGRDNDKLIAIAETVEDGEMLEKYL